VPEVQQLILRVPDLIDGVLTWVNGRMNSRLSRHSVLSAIHLSPERIAASAGDIGVSVLGFVGTAVGAAFSLFTFGMFLFSLSADLKRLERWIASLFPPRHQAIAATVWRLTAEKTGEYVGARALLAGINAATTAIVFVVIGRPYWLALALWTGIVAQFVPIIGTYVSIALPVIVGRLTPTPWIGWVGLAWAVLHQQVENVTIEPRISAKAVDVNPAVSFGAVLMGAALFGVAGAFLAVPVVAMVLAVLEIYGNRYDLLPDVAEAIDSTESPPFRKAAVVHGRPSP
jgi:predicted PurR-regulated permease PerM